MKTLSFNNKRFQWTVKTIDRIDASDLGTLVWAGKELFSVAGTLVHRMTKNGNWAWIGSDPEIR